MTSGRIFTVILPPTEALLCAHTLLLTYPSASFQAAEAHWCNTTHSCLNTDRTQQNPQPPLTLHRRRRRQRFGRGLCRRRRADVWQQGHGGSHERLEQGCVAGVAGSQGHKDAQQVLHLRWAAIPRREVLALQDRRLQTAVRVLGLQEGGWGWGAVVAVDQAQAAPWQARRSGARCSSSGDGDAACTMAAEAAAGRCGVFDPPPCGRPRGSPPRPGPAAWRGPGCAGCRRAAGPATAPRASWGLAARPARRSAPLGRQRSGPAGRQGCRIRNKADMGARPQGIPLMLAASMGMRHSW